MLRIEHIIKDPRGIHARPAGQLVKVVSGFSCDVQIGKENSLVDGKRLLAVMKLAMACGEKLIIEFNGADEAQAYEATEKFLQSNL